MSNKRSDLLWGSFIGDALSMGPHWVYDRELLKDSYGRITGYTDPFVQPYHVGKTAGDFTHLGDQTLVLLESLSEMGGFDLDHFSNAWQSFFNGHPDVYVDAATRGTRSNYSNGLGADDAGSQSDELAGASRIAPLVYYYHDDPDTLLETVHLQTKMTHNNRYVLDGAAFFTFCTLDVLDGVTPSAAMDRAANRPYDELPVREWVDIGFRFADTESASAIQQFGQSCPIVHSFPSVVQIVARYEDDIQNGLIENVMAGGDSAARGLLIGMLLGAHCGTDDLPREWFDELHARDHIAELMD